MIHIIEDLSRKTICCQRWCLLHVDSAPEKYGQLTGQSIDAVRQGAGGRVDKTGSGKRDRDFALWKQAKPESQPGLHLGVTVQAGTLNAVQ